METRFWEHVDRLVSRSKVVIDRPRGTSHPRYPDAIYPIDYGYLEGTAAIDGGGIDVWRGSLPDERVTGAIVTVDLFKRDSEVKLLVGCTMEEAELALATHETVSQSGLLLVRPDGRDAAAGGATYDIEIRELQPQAVAGIRAITTRAEIAATFRELLPEIAEYLREVEIAPVGAPYVRYFHVGADRVDLEVGIRVERPIEGNARVEPGELPGGEAATTVHIGPYDGLATAYEALVGWIRDEGRQETSAPWEVYETDPEEMPDPARWETRIYWPVL